VEVFRKFWHILISKIRFPSKRTALKNSIGDDQYYYKLSTTCQIPELGKIYEQYFHKRTDGCFVEIGAYDGEYASNTSGLADIGWFGYYVEPIPEYSQRCVARHIDNKNVTTSQYAIGAKLGQVDINIGGPLSTIRNEMKTNFESMDWAVDLFVDERVKVQQMTLEEYLVKHNVKLKFELLVIDVEGYEWNVLRNFDITKWQPQMVIIELHDQNDNYLLIRDECNDIVRYFANNRYKIIYKDFSNTIYVPENSYPGI